MKLCTELDEDDEMMRALGKAHEGVPGEVSDRGAHVTGSSVVKMSLIMAASRRNSPI